MGAGDNNLDLAIRIKAEATQAKAALGEVQAQLKGVETAAKTAGGGADAYTQQMSKLQVASNKAAKQSRDTAAALALMAKIDPASGKLDSLDKLEASLRKLRGAMDPADFARMGEILASQRATLTGVGKDLEHVGKSAINARTQYSAFALISDAATGQFSRGRREVAALANETGLLGGLLNPVGIAIGVVAAAVVGLTAAMVAAEREASAFSDAIAQTGKFSGTTAQGLREMAAALQVSGVSVRSANEAVLEIAKTGKFSGDQIRQVAQAVEDMARGTGTSLKDATKQALHLAEDPVAGLNELQSTMHMVSIEAIDQARAYMDVGDKAGAAQVAINEYGRIAQTVLQQHQQELGTVRTFWQDLRKAISDATTAVLDFDNKSKNASQLAAARAVLEQNIANGNVQRDASGGLSLTAQGRASASIGEAEGANVFGSSLTQRLAGAADVYKRLGGAAEDAAQSSAKTAAQQQKIAEAGELADQSIAGLAKGYDKAADRARAVAEVTRNLNAIMHANRSLPNGVMAAPDGVDSFSFSGKGFDYLVNKKLGAEGRTRAGRDLGVLQANAAISAAQNAVKQVQDIYINGQKALDAQHKAGLVSDAAYYDAERGMLTVWEDDKVAALEKEKVAAQSHIKTQADRVKADQKVAEIDQQLTQVHAEASAKRQQIDAQEQEAIKKTQAAWEKFQNSLGTPLEIHTGQVLNKLNELDQFFTKNATGGEAGYADALNRIFGGIDGRGPRGVGTLMAGSRFSAQMAEVKQYYADIASIQQKAYQQEMAAAQGNAQRQLDIQKAYEQASLQSVQNKANAEAAIKRQEAQFALSSAQQGFTALAQVYAQAYGEQSRQAKIAFALQKASTLANAILAIQESVANSSKMGFPWNIISIAGAIAQGAAVLATIRSTNLNVGGYAAGGAIHGAGTGTSDSITIRASNGEYMHNAAAVDHYGLAFMDAVNSRTLPKLPGYATGGLIGGSAPSPSQLGFKSPSTPTVGSGNLMVAVTPVTVIVHSSGNGDDVQSKQSTDSNGGQVLELFLGMVAKDINQGGQVAKAADARWILQRKATRYG